MGKSHSVKNRHNLLGKLFDDQNNSRVRRANGKSKFPKETSRFTFFFSLKS